MQAINNTSLVGDYPSSLYGRNFNELSKFTVKNTMDVRHKSQGTRRNKNPEGQFLLNSNKISRKTVRQQVFRKEISTNDRNHTSYNAIAVERNRMKNLNKVKNIISS